MTDETRAPIISGTKLTERQTTILAAYERAVKEEGPHNIEAIFNNVAREVPHASDKELVIELGTTLKLASENCFKHADALVADREARQHQNQQ